MNYLDDLLNEMTMDRSFEDEGYDYDDPPLAQHTIATVDQQSADPSRPQKQETRPGNLNIYMNA